MCDLTFMHTRAAQFGLSEVQNYGEDMNFEEGHEVGVQNLEGEKEGEEYDLNTLYVYMKFSKHKQK